MDNKTTFEKKLEIVAKICTILIPVLLFYFGNELQKSKDAENLEQQNFNRIATLLKSLSSENPLEKKLAIKFSQSLAAKKKFPSELLTVMNEVAVSDPVNSKGAQSVIEVVNKNADNALQNQIKTTVESSPSKIYTQISPDYNLASAKNLIAELHAKGYNMLGIERVTRRKSLQNNEVLYFKDNDKNKADSLAVYTSNILKQKINARYVKGYEQKIVGSQLEIWLMR